MNIEEFREYCIKKPFTTEEFPFNDVTLVFKVKGKMFALTSLDKEFSVNLKCEPEIAIQLREKYIAVQPGFHMNKRHWNTVVIDGSIPKESIFKLIDMSYQLVIETLPKKTQKEINQLNS